MFDGQIYSPIPAAISASNLASLLQLFSNFGYVAVNRTGECNQYAYTIQWLVNGEQPLISIANSSQVRPINAPITVSSIQRGSATNVFFNLPNDILRTYHTTPQVSFFPCSGFLFPIALTGRSTCRWLSVLLFPRE
jgi:hypothetical protein